MALQFKCDQGHSYVAPNLLPVDWIEDMPLCPECRQEWLKAREKTEKRAKRIADISASNKLGEKLCEVLGLDPMHVHSITVSAAADEPIYVDVGMYVGDRELLEMDWHTSFAKAKITVKDHDETP